MEIADPGGSSPSWDGSIKVDPGALEASAPGFEGAGNEITLAMASTIIPFADPGGIGITDPGAAGAWSSLTTIWTGDLNNLSNGYGQIAGALPVGGATYTQTDGAVLATVTVTGTQISAT